MIHPKSTLFSFKWYGLSWRYSEKLPRSRWIKFKISSLRVARDQVKLAKLYDIEDSASVISPEELLGSV